MVDNTLKMGTRDEDVVANSDEVSAPAPLGDSCDREQVSGSESGPRKRTEAAGCMVGLRAA